MAIITSPITDEGAVLTVLVGVSANRQRMLEKMSFPVPVPVQVKALLDTGSSDSAFQASVFKALQLTPIGKMYISTPSTDPSALHDADTFDVSVTFRSGNQTILIESIQPFVTNGFDPTVETAQALIGRDILNRCVFNYNGQTRQFALVLNGSNPLP